MTNEEFYDQEIAPVLLDLAKRCEDRGLSFLSVVEWEPGNHGRTVSLREGHGNGIKIANLSAMSNGNADHIIMALMRIGRDHGHSSACLNILGVPTTPQENA